MKTAIRVTEFDISCYKAWTYIVFGFWVAIGSICGLGVGGIVVYYILINRWLPQREAGLQTLLVQCVDDLDALSDYKVKELTDYVQEHEWKTLMATTFGFATVPLEELVTCRTCGQEYNPNTIQNIKLCWNLRDSFPHSPTNDPPHNNPFEYYWLQSHGYRKPDIDWPKNLPWLPKTAIFGTQAMRDEGKVYYQTHPNTLWDSGFGTIPEWYRQLKRIAV